MFLTNVDPSALVYVDYFIPEKGSMDTIPMSADDLVDLQNDLLSQIRIQGIDDIECENDGEGHLLSIRVTYRATSAAAWNIIDQRIDWLVKKTVDVLHHFDPELGGYKQKNS